MQPALPDSRKLYFKKVRFFYRLSIARCKGAASQLLATRRLDVGRLSKQRLTKAALSAAPTGAEGAATDLASTACSLGAHRCCLPQPAAKHPNRLRQSIPTRSGAAGKESFPTLPAALSHASGRSTGHAAHHPTFLPCEIWQSVRHVTESEDSECK